MLVFAHQEFKARTVKMDVPQEPLVRNVIKNAHNVVQMAVVISYLATANVILVSLDHSAIFLALHIPLDQTVEASASVYRNIRRSAIPRQANVNVKLVSPALNAKWNVHQIGGEKLAKILATVPQVPSVILEMENA